MTKLSLKAKLFFLCLFMGAVSSLIASVGYYGLNSITSNLDQVSTKAVPNLVNLNKMYLDFKEIRINLRSLGFSNITPEQRQKFIAAVKTSLADYEVYNKKYLAVEFQPGEEEIYKKVSVAWENFKVVGTNVLEINEKGGPGAQEKMLKIFLVDCARAAAAFDEPITELQLFHTQKAFALAQSGEQSSKSAIWRMILISFIGVGLGLITGWLVSTKLSAQITRLVEAVSDSSSHVASTSSQIAEASQQLALNSADQASSLTQTASSLEEITSMIAKSSDNSEAAANSSGVSHKKAEEGRNAVNQMLNSMDEISRSNDAILKQTDESNREMTEIVRVIQEIGDKTRVINEIVFQTKLLSFNASVEAARAGEHGKGFAVVAEEVGRLAQMSGNAAKDISDLLTSSTSRVEGIVKSTQEKVETLVKNGKDKVSSGVTVAQYCSQVLNDIVENVSEVANLSKDIFEAGKEQSKGVDEINKAVAKLDTVTQQNNSTSEEAASAANELSKQAESLSRAVNGLFEVVTGKVIEDTNGKTESVRNVVHIPQQRKFAS